MIMIVVVIMLMLMLMIVIVIEGDRFVVIGSNRICTASASATSVSYGCLRCSSGRIHEILLTQTIVSDVGRILAVWILLYTGGVTQIGLLLQQ